MLILLRFPPGHRGSKYGKADIYPQQNFPPDVKQKASIYLPAIGKVTIAVLLRNLLRITQNRQLQEAAQSQEQHRGQPTGAEGMLPNGKLEKILDS